MDQKRLIEYLLFATLTGSAAMMVGNIAKMSDNLMQISISVQELNARIQVLTTQMVQTSNILQDHESRIRNQERLK